MVPTRQIWVLPEINGKDSEISKFSCGLLSEASEIAETVGGSTTALILGDQIEDHSKILGQYGINSAYVFKHPLLKYFSAEAYFKALAERVYKEKPWLFLMGNTTVGKELAPRLALLLETGVVSNCVKMDFINIETPKFYRAIYGEQAYQEVVFRNGRTMLITMAPGVLNITPGKSSREVNITRIEPVLSSEDIRAKHIDYLPADYRTVDVSDAGVIVAAGMGSIGDDIFPLVEELACLLEGAIGTTRPVVDEGKIARERMIGQTGKIVSPDLYLGLGVSGATHHIGGIQDSKTVISLNRDPQAPIFQNSDIGVVADLKEILPELINKIRQAKKDEKIF